MQQNPKVIIVLGVTMHVLGSCGCSLWLYCLNYYAWTQIKQVVDVDRPLVVLVVFEVKAINVLGIIMLVLGLDKNKT